MKKKAVSLILSLCMTFSLFVQFVPLVKAEEISDIPDPWVNPQDYVDGTATFNLDWLVSFVCAKNPQEVTFDDIISEEYQYYFGAQEVSSETLLNVKGYITANDMLWFEVEAAEGSSIPDILAENPYLLYMATEEDAPALLITAPSSDDGSADDPAQEEPPADDGVLLPPQLDSEHYTIEEIGQKGYFNQNEVMLYSEPLGTALSVVSVPVSQLDDFIDVVYKVTDNRYSTPTAWYVILGTDNCEAVKDWQYVYLPALGTDLVLVDNDVTEAYEKLLKADKVDKFDEIAEELGSDIFEKFTEKHIENLGSHYNEMVEAETVTYTRNDITYKGRPVTVNVTGLIPENVTLVVSEVDDGTVLDDDFDIDKAEDIILALDIKLIDEQGNEWQPKNNRQIEVAIDVTGLGIADGTIFQLEHKHGDEIHKFDVFIVMDGKLTVRTNGFSLYVVSKNDNADVPNRPGNNARPLNANITMEVGDVEYFYADPNGLNNNNPTIGTWQIEDPTGAIYWEVYTSNDASNSGVYAPWIKIVALKEIENLTLNFVYRSGNNQTESYNLKIEKPKPGNEDIDGYKLYIKDTVNVNGCISAVLADAGGNDITLEGTRYSWERDDDAYIMATSFENKDQSVNICRDHGGVLDNRRTPVKYTVTATLPNGMEKEASYTVYYQSEIINAAFESPAARPNDYTFFPNGMVGLYWKTTSPGEEGNLTRDIEYASYTPGHNDPLDTNRNVSFYPNKPGGGSQFAEVNAEKFGALYQDIIAGPGEDIEWQFLHAKRDGHDNGEALFIILGPTEKAQEITSYNEVKELLKGIDINTRNSLDKSNEPITITYKNATYTVWYHHADRDEDHKTSQDAWALLSGSYQVPENQYRTRLFFVSDPVPIKTSNQNYSDNYGNLIDSSKAGQYKTFLVEYYEESFNPDTATRTLTHFKNKDESGTAILYSSVELNKYEYFEETEKDLLSTIYINGQNYPYNIKYKDGKPCLFIEKYKGTPEHYPVTNTETDDDYTPNDYSQYDIVMQVFFRDTLIAVQKWVDFPTITDEDGAIKEALSPSQKQDLIDELLNEGDKVGYEAKFKLDCTSTDLHTDENKLEGHFAEKAIHITQNDPYGWYTGYIPFGDNPGFEHVFTLKETNVSQLTGLELESVKFIYYKFKDGERIPEVTVTHNAGENVEYSVSGIKISDNDDGSRLAEIEVRNKYREKEIIINYEAVGRGGVDVQGNSDTTFKDKDCEVLNYYSEISNGVKVKPEGKYVFAGWFLDKECTIPVDENHGYVDAQGGFIPNKSKTFSDEVLEVTYYAKFDIGSLQIIRENAEPGEVFVYKVENTLTDSSKVVMYVTVTIGQDGKGSTNIINVPFAPHNQEPYTYTVTEMKDWSWRYPEKSITKEHIRSEGLHGATNMMTTFTFSDDEINDSWLNGNSAVVKNVYGGVS